ncbi:MAG: hypothetical protein V7636_1959 [Actinomycetota bacterium]|jgi:hypothetical protein
MTVEEYLAEVERLLPGAADIVRPYIEDESSLARLGTPAEVVARMKAQHRHLDAVTLPDGTTVVAVSFSSAYERDAPPDFGLYLDERWDPPWPHAHVDWPDFGLPADPDAFVAALEDLRVRSRRGEVVELGCLGAHGRTGTALACLAVLAGVDGDPVDWVRSTYCDKAVETDEQAAFARQTRRSPR